MTARKCRHEITADKYGETTHDHIGNIVYEVLFRECLDCGEWLSLGPSNDAGCEVEIRAAELAAVWDSNDGHWNGFESLGMCSPDAEHAPIIEDGIAEGRKQPRDLTDYYAGHLARVIAEHDDQLRKVGG